MTIGNLYLKKNIIKIHPKLRNHR